MKRLSMLLVAGMLLFVPALAFASNGDTLNIGGQVPLVLDLTVTPVGNYDDLPLSGSVTVNQTIATVEVHTNNKLGWELWIYGANSVGAQSFLESADGDTLEYTLTFGATTSGVDAGGRKFGEDTADIVAPGTDLEINYTQLPDLKAGYYSDQLSIVLRAK
ncbi:MAG: hypothetical protein ACOC0O_07565 [Spirochaetota bacterium]